MRHYTPVCRVLGRDETKREDQDTWNLVGDDPTVIKLLSAVDDIGYHLDGRSTRSQKLIIAKLEEAMYDRLKYD